MRYFIDIKIDRIALEREYEKLTKGSVDFNGLKKRFVKSRLSGRINC